MSTVAKAAASDTVHEAQHIRLGRPLGAASANVVADLIPPLVNIFADDKFKGLFSVKKLAEGEDAVAAARSRLVSAVPLLIKVHARDLYTIIAVVRGVSVAEYTDGLTPLKLVGDAVELVADPDVWELVKSLTGTLTTLQSTLTTFKVGA